MPSRPDRRYGFTLIEIAIVVMIIGIVIKFSIDMGDSMWQSARITSNQQKLDTIEEALKAYRTAYGRLPCPASLTTSDSNANAGVEAANPGSCQGGTPAANFFTTTVAQGAVPIKALNLPLEFMYDAYGKRFTYAVALRATQENGVKNLGLDALCGSTVNGAGGTNITTGALYVLVSHGPNGHGGYKPNNSRFDADSSDADELENCECDADAAATTPWDSLFVQKTQTDTFDDIVRFKERSQLMTEEDKYVLPGGFCNWVSGVRLDGDAANVGFGYSVAVGSLNGDYYKDIAVRADLESSSKGTGYAIFGRNGSRPFQVSGTVTPYLNGTQGFKVSGVIMWDLSNMLPDIQIEDINGDNYGELILNGFGGTSSGRVWVLNGIASGWLSDYPTNSTYFDGARGYQFYGNNDDTVGQTVTVADLDGDNIKDLIFGGAEQSNTALAISDAGAAWILYGKSGARTASVLPAQNTAPFNGTDGFTLMNQSVFFNGTSVHGDVDGDGRQDLLVNNIMCGTHTGVNNSGCIYGFFGRSSRSWSAVENPEDAALLNGTKGFRLNGVSVNQYIGSKALGSGDLNNDGFSDIIFSDSATSLAVLFGKDTWAGTQNMTAGTFNGTDGFTITGLAAAGWYYSLTTCNINNDAYQDLIIGDQATDTVYVLYGRPIGGGSGWPPTFDVSSLTAASTGFAITGVAGSLFGFDVACANIDNDSYDDLIIGAPRADLNGADSGSVYILYGRASGWANTQTAASLVTN